MKWYKRLFWKVFAAIWSVSFLVLIATVFVITFLSERDRYQDVLMTKAEGYAELMIERYERHGSRTLRVRRLAPKNKHPEHKDEHGDRRGEHWERERRDHDRRSHKSSLQNIVHRVDILDTENDRKVVAIKPLNPDSQHLKHFSISSEKGRLYEVTVDLSPRNSLYSHVMGKILTAQMVLILLVAALGALLVSTIIARPLKQLRAYSQAIYSGELATRTDEKLSLRGDELGELARDFDRMADYVEQTLTSHQRLMQDVSHELRAPLARLQAAAGIAEQRLGEDDKTVQRIIRECRRLDALIGELLSLSRLEQMEGSGEPTSLAAFLKGLVEDVQFSNRQRQVELNVISDCQVSVNNKLLERALNNIIGNACKHTPEDSAIEVSVANGERCEIRVRDHGPGVTEEQLEHLCEPFYRADAKTEGYGLGLSIAQRAISRMGGELRMQNHPYGGLEVTLLLPCSR